MYKMSQQIWVNRKYELFILSIVAPDLYEVIPKQTCFPERNRKYDTKFEAKMDCGKDKACSGVVEAPKRRGQNRKSPYGNYSLTDREFILCEYPLATKATDDTFLFKKRGNHISKKSVW